MAGIFLSYRRSDATGWAGRLHDSLVQRLPGVKIFMDVEEIPPGVRFADYIHEAVGSCDVLLALIGPAWLTVTKDNGTRRLDDPQDFVRLEIAAAIERGVRVVPTLVGGAAMPSSESVPEALKELCERQNYELPDRAWEDGCNRLAKALKGIVKTEQVLPSKPPVDRRALAVGATVVALALGTGVTAWTLLRSSKPGVSTPAPAVAFASAPAPAPGVTPAFVPASASAPASATSPATAPPLATASSRPAPTRRAASANAERPAPTTSAAASAPSVARSRTGADDELWAAAEASQRRSHYIDYLFRFPAGAHAAAAQAKAGGVWLRDASTRCAIWQSGASSGEAPRVTWKGACAGGKAQGKGTGTEDHASQNRRVIAESTLTDGMDNGPCAVESLTDGKPRVRERGTCQNHTEGSVAYTFDGTREEFEPDGTIKSSFTGVIVTSWAGEREYRGEHTFPKTGTTFSGTAKGELSDGTLKLKSGTTIRCKFVKGQPNGSGCEARYADGGFYKGDFVAGKRAGRGVLNFASGGAYEGDFRDGQPWGQGVSSTPDGTKIIGGFVAGKVDGDVVLVDKSGLRTPAHFVAGTRDR